jgi:hypothetical protein
VSRGAYRIIRPEGDLVETFVEAPGPAGWRWFGRVHDLSSGDEVYVVDHVVDAEWRVVRFRLLHREAGEVVVEPALEGLALTAGQVIESLAGAEIVWSPSPASLLVLQRYLQSRGATGARGVQVSASGSWEAVTVGLEDQATAVVDGTRLPVTWAGDMPSRVDGWFELLPEGHPLRP